MKKFNKKSLALLIAAALLLTIAVSGTVAYLVDSTGSLVNTFTPTEVGTTITDDVTTGEKKTIIINNPSGDKKIAVYVRVAIVGNWVKKVNGTEMIVSPATDAELSFTPGEDWEKSGNYYYYTKAVKPGASTTDLLQSSIKATTKADGSYLVVTVLHQSIQAEPVSAVQNAWGWTPPSATTN